MIFRPILTVFLLGLAVFSGSQLDARTWTHEDGRTFDGELLRVEGDTAVIRRDVDRQVFEVDIAVLSPADQAYLRDDPPVSWWNVDDRLWLFIGIGATLMLALSLYFTYRAGVFMDLPGWTFGRSIYWHLYYWFLGIISNIVTAVFMYFTVPNYDVVEYYTNPQAYDSLRVDQLLFSIVSFFVLLYFYAKFLRIGMLRTFGFLILEVLAILLATVGAGIITFVVAWAVGFDAI